MKLIELPLFHDDVNPTLDGETVVLVIDRETGEIYDEAWSVPTVENYALYSSQEYAFLAVGEEAERWQKICDYNGEIWADCFGLTTPSGFIR